MRIDVNTAIAGAVAPLIPSAPVLPEPVQFDFTVPSATWTIQHNLGWNPLVQLIDANGVQFESDVEYPDNNTVMVTHSKPITGSAVLK